MFTEQSFLTATPLAFLLLFPVFFYYCLRNLHLQQENPKAPLTHETRIPEYLIKQHVDKTRKFRNTANKKVSEIKVKEKESKIYKKVEMFPSPETLGSCSVALPKYAVINQQFGQKSILVSKNRRNTYKNQSLARAHKYFVPTSLTTIYENVEY